MSYSHFSGVTFKNHFSNLIYPQFIHSCSLKAFAGLSFSY